MTRVCFSASIVFLYLFLPILNGQTLPIATNSKSDNYPILENDAEHPCITPEEYAMIEKRCNENVQSLKLLKRTSPGIVSLDWPLKPSSDLHDCSYYMISAYVDQNTTTGVFQDFNCGTNTYDGHRGTDIAIWPYGFYKMDNNLVEIIAAAPGIIIDKHDGEFDKNCSSNSLLANYVIIQQDDGSRILYWHMKKNSVTPKAIGQSVVRGEYLGGVGSSGSSTGPHLHFEVWSGSTIATRIDPFAGTCNTLNQKSWWTSQKMYKETAIIHASVNTTDVVLPPCPETEIPNESKVFQIPFQGKGLSPGYAKFYIFIRNQKSGLTENMSILNPDGSIFLDWTYTSPSDYLTSIQGWSKKLPTIAGKYTFKSVYNGLTCSSNFEIVFPTNNNTISPLSELKIYPNPSSGKFMVETKYGNDQEFEIYNLLGVKIYHSKITNPKSEINIQLPHGIHFYQLKVNNQIVDSGKLLID